MGWYADHLFPRLMDRVLGTGPVQMLRRQALAEVRGEVLEIGFGTGLNLAHYCRQVTRLTAVDPVSMLPARVSQRIAAAPFPVRQMPSDASGRLPFEALSFDFIVSTFTLCSIAEVEAALREVGRLLKPGGSFIFLEHGRSDDDRIARWQDRLNPIQNVLGCGCHLNRQIDRLITRSGLRIDRLERFLLPAAPRVMGEIYQGAAVSAVRVDLSTGER